PLDLAAHARCPVVLPRRLPHLDRLADALDHTRRHRAARRAGRPDALAAQATAAGLARYRPVPRLPVAYQHHPAAGADLRAPQLLRQLRPAAGDRTVAGGATRRSLRTSTSRTAGRVAAVLDRAHLA